MKGNISLLFNFAFVFAFVLLTSFELVASPLPLDSYLKQVKTQNKTILSNDLASESYKLREGEASLDFMPYATGSVNYSDDKRLNSFSNYFGTEAVNESANLGLQDKFRTGTQASFNYNLAYIAAYNTAFIPGQTNFIQWTAAPQISITQPLWRDFNASLSKAHEEASLAGLKAQSLSAQYSNQQVIFNAETAYWTLALDREIVRLDRESIERTTKILNRNERRVKMNVADRSDLLQSLASLKNKELTYQSDVEALRETALQFNSLRNVAGDQVVEEVQIVNAYLDQDLAKEIKRTGERLDLLVAIANAQNQRAQAKASEVTNQPDIELTGSYQFDGLGPNSATATGTSWNPDHPYLSAGLTLKIPLDQSEVSRMNQGYAAQVAAAEYAIEKAKFDLEQDWLDLLKHFKDALSRLDLARELEKLQSEKLKWERERFNFGRTTSFQVLQFEDDFSAASLARLRIENELVSMRAKARLYNGGAQ